MLYANGIVGALGFTLHELKRLNPALGLQIGTSCFNMIFQIAFAGNMIFRIASAG